MMKKLNEQLNIDLKNGTWSISTGAVSNTGGGSNSAAGSNTGAGSNSAAGNNSGAGSNSSGRVASTNPKSPDYYNDYETDEIISVTGKNVNYNNTGDYSDYVTDEKIGNTTTQVNDYSDYSDDEKNDYSDYSDDEQNDKTPPATSNTKTPTDNTRVPMATNSLTPLTKIELDIMKQNNPLVFKTAYDKLGSLEKKAIDDKLAGK